MAGKGMAMASPRLAYALDQMSKNALADLVVDLVRGAVGERADEQEVAASLQPHVDAVLRVRKDKPCNLSLLCSKFDQYQDEHRKRMTGWRPPEEIAAEKALCEEQERQRAMCEKIRQHNLTAKVVQ